MSDHESEAHYQEHAVHGGGPLPEDDYAEIGKRRPRAKRPARRFTTKVVGVTFIEDYPENLHDLARIQRRRERRNNDEPLSAILIRNPENQYDPNAIEVHQPSVGMIGHLPRDVAARLAPCLDDGETWQASLGEVRISPEAEEQPGVDVHVERIEDDHDKNRHPRYEEYLAERNDEGAR